MDDNTSVIALECEVVSDIGKNIKKIFSNEDVIVLGYSNSSVCYIPTRRILLEGGYESTSFITARLAGPFVQETEDTIIGISVKMLKDIK
jgi:neutral ceramidase